MGALYVKPQQRLEPNAAIFAKLVVSASWHFRNVDCGLQWHYVIHILWTASAMNELAWRCTVEQIINWNSLLLNHHGEFISFLQSVSLMNHKLWAQGSAAMTCLISRNPTISSETQLDNLQLDKSLDYTCRHSYFPCMWLNNDGSWCSTDRVLLCGVCFDYGCLCMMRSYWVFGYLDFGIQYLFCPLPCCDRVGILRVVIYNTGMCISRPLSTTYIFLS